MVPTPLGRAGREREAFPKARGFTNESKYYELRAPSHPPQHARPARTHEPYASPTDDNAQQTHDLLEESVITLLRQHCPTYLKMDGVPVRLALARAFVRFILERTRGNQARAAELAGFNRNTLRRLIRCFRIDWAFYAAK